MSSQPQLASEPRAVDEQTTLAEAARKMEQWHVGALIVTREGTTATEEELIAHCRDNMAHFKCPTSVRFVEELPRTATGKLQKYKLREAFWDGDRKVAG